MEPSVAIVIPARAGSKGVPGKNMERVGGLTLVARAVRTALNVTDNVYVSSDGPQILREAAAHGAIGILRPHSLAGDSASSEAALLHALSVIGDKPQFTVMMQCTSPFTKVQDLVQALEMLKTQKFDSVFSGVEDHGFFWKIAGPGAQECLPIGQPKNYRPRRQDLAQNVRETGSFYVMETSKFEAEGFRFFGKVGVVFETSKYVIDIDTHRDLELAQHIANLSE